MIPLKDDAPRVGTPYINYTLLVMNIAAFLFELRVQQVYGTNGFNTFLSQFGVVPARFSVVVFNHGYVPWDLVSALGMRYISPLQAFLPVLTSMFLHGGWLHLIFNMWALWI